jgi:Lon-like ATP-dependent protease
MIRHIVKTATTVASNNRRNKSSIHQFSQSHQSHQIPHFLSTTTRSFFWNNNDDNSGNGKGKGANGKEKSKGNKEKKIEAKSKDGDDRSSSSPSSRTVVSEGSGGNSGSSSMPVRLGFGDEAPRYPHLTALPVVNRPLFPGIVTSVTVTDERTIQQLEKISNNKTAGGGAGGYVGVFLRNQSGEDGNGNINSNSNGLILEQPELITDVKDLYNVGTFAQIHRVTRGLGLGGNGADTATDPDSQQADFNAQFVQVIDGENGNGSDGINTTNIDEPASISNPASVLLLAHRRIDLLSVDNIGPPIDTTVSHWEKLIYKMGKDNDMDDTIRALSNEILKAIRELAQHNPLFRENVTFFPTRVDSNDPYRLADFAASLTTGSAHELQAVLEEKDPEIRLHKALVLLSKER